MKIKTINKKLVSRPDQVPDIDLDFESVFRDEVKYYLEQQYGEENVCSIGTFGRLKLKAALKDFSRFFGVPFKQANIMTKYISEKEKDDFKSIVFSASTDSDGRLKSFLKNLYEVIFCVGRYI